MSAIRCFWLEPTGQVEMTLRRFTFGSVKSCGDSKAWGHNASAVIGQARAAEAPSLSGDPWPHIDERWPRQCERCGYAFAEEDEWQFNSHPLLRRADTGELFTLARAPAGAMWDAPWLRDVKSFKRRPDGIVLIVRTPGGDWFVDGPSSNGNGWERSGSASGRSPDVSATPSIIAGSYHGWLRNGELVAA